MNFLKIFLLGFFQAVISIVVELTDNDFDERLQDKYAMVMFYGPNCEHCQQMQPAYELLSSHHKVLKHEILISRVDCTTAGKWTCGKYRVSGYPTIKFVSRMESTETVTDYDGSRDFDALLSFVIDQSRPAFKEIADNKIKKFIDSSKIPVVVGFFKNAHSSLCQKLKDIARAHRFEYLVGISFSEQAAHAHDKKLETVVLFRPKHLRSKREPKSYTCAIETELFSCLEKHKYSIVEYRDIKNQQNFKVPLIVAYITIDPFLKRKEAKRVRGIIVKTALKNTDITFTISKKREFESIISVIAPRMAGNDIYLVAYDIEENIFVGKSVGSVEDPSEFETILQKFVTDFKKGGVLDRFIFSQPADTPDDGHIKVVTGLTFQRIVMDSDKDVLVQFYSPGCGHCRKLAPIYKRLATWLKDEQNIVISKYDILLNEAQKQFPVAEIPKIYLAKSGEKNLPIPYSGKREAEDMLDWLKRNAKHNILFDIDDDSEEAEL